MLSVTYSPNDVSARFGCKVDKVLLLINRGELNAFDTAPGGSKKPRWRISEESLIAFEQSRSKTKSPVLSKPRRTQRERFDFI